jgi:hypothetical protein
MPDARKTGEEAGELTAPAEESAELYCETPMHFGARMDGMDGMEMTRGRASDPQEATP